MLELTYRDNNHNIFKMKLDRLNKKLYECSIKTHDEYIETKWNRLFDAGKERSQDFITARYDDTAFIKCLSIWFGSRYGYTLLEAKHGD